MQLHELLPGDHLEGPFGQRTTFIEKQAHPLFGGLLLVIWKTDEGQVYLDALLPNQELPLRYVDDTMDPEARRVRLQKTLLGE